MAKLSSWNRIPQLMPDKVSAISLPAIPSCDVAPRPLLAFGNGRSYGDVCLNNKGTLLHTRYLDRFISYDRASGLIRCQSGVTLDEILELVVPDGWFLPCTPGTRYVTVGGALANDVHGKNHHIAGTFGHHVSAFELLRSDGEKIHCSAETNPDYYHATIGGLGLTGLVSWVEIQLAPIQSPWLLVESFRFKNINEFWGLNAQLELEWPYTVAWLDCLSRGKHKGRGIIFAGKHAPPQAKLSVPKERNLSVPFDTPFSLINSTSLRCFNELYYNQPLKQKGALQHYSSYFYPLDSVKYWNRIYGRNGFFQYQCVIPTTQAKAAIDDLLETIARSRQGSFLAVLKTFGCRQSAGMLSFARQGATLALDFPNQGQATTDLLTQLDSIVGSSGGALYPAKDARMSASIFQSGYPQWQEFSRFVDPDFSSHFWERVTT